MKIYRLLLFFVLFSEKSHSELLNTISITAPEYWCPYACDAKSSEKGFTIEIAIAAFKAVNIKVNYINEPYDRALMDVNNGRIDAVLPTFKSEAPSFIYPQEVLSTTRYCFYTINSNWQYTGLTSLSNIKFSATSGYSYSPEMDELIKKNQNRQVELLRGDNIPERMYKMLTNSRIDAVLEDTRLMDYMIKTQRVSVLPKRSGCLDIVHYGYLALSPANSDRSEYFAQQFDKGLKLIQKNNIPTTILLKYGISSF